MDEYLEKCKREMKEYKEWCNSNPLLYEYLKTHTIQEFLDDKNGPDIKLRDYYKLRFEYQVDSKEVLNSTGLDRFSLDFDRAWKENSDLIPQEASFYRDYCIAVDFGDNDFWDYFEEAGKIIGERHKRIVNNLLYYLTFPDIELPSTSIPKKWSNTESMKRFILDCVDISTKLHDWDDTEEEYTGEHDKSYYRDYFKNIDVKIGTEKEIESWIQERANTCEPLEQIWLNSEVLFIKFKEGKQRIWIQ